MGEISFLCRPSRSKGICFAENPLDSPFSRLMAQIILFNLTSRLLYSILKPLGQTKFVCNLLGGIILGPSVIGQNKVFRNQLYGTNEEIPLFRVIPVIGVLYSIFLISVKFDPHLIKKTAQSSWKIGALTFLFPSIILLYPITQVRILNSFYAPNFLILLTGILSWSMSFFPVITEALYELNLMTSELGQLAMSSAILNDAALWFLVFLNMAVSSQGIPVLLSTVGLLLFTVYVLRPLMLMIVKKTPQGEQVKEIYIVGILLGVLVMTFVTDAIGLVYNLGPLLLGLIIPDGPPLGSTLTAKTEFLVSEFLMPVLFSHIGNDVNVFLIDNWTRFAKLQTIIVALFVTKIVGVTLAGLCCKISLRNSLVLSMVMSMKGIIEVMMYHRLMTFKMIDGQFFTQLILSALMITMIVTPIVHFSYTPQKQLQRSTRYSQARSIQSLPNSASSGTFQILCCVHSEESARSIITFLEASNPTNSSPICTYLVHLVDLVGSSAPQLTPYKKKKFRRLDSPSHQMMRAFENYSENSKGPVTIHPYTVVAPCKSMHEFIFRLAREKFVPLIIIPFVDNHDQTIGGASTSIVSQLNRNLQAFSQCTIGILVEKRLPCRASSVSNFSYVVAVFFIGGPDDREALAYASRMANNPDVDIMVFRTLVQANKTENIEEREREFELDESLLDEFKLRNARNERLKWRDIVVNDGVEVVNAIKNLQGMYDLVMVGRRHVDFSFGDEEMAGLLHYPELGVIGDMLASSDFCGGMVNVLVMQESRSLSCGTFYN
ncbi:PREDICTED: cation/H(+) antiporter 15-like [Fragaria vesca subsp. vesca]